AEMHTTIFSIGESPKNPNLIWVGTDDGNVQLTRDGGKSWKNLVSNIKDLPKNAWVTSIEAGHFSEGTAYASFDLHTFGDMRPYVYKTSDFGQTWTQIVAPISNVKGYAHVVKEDLVNQNLLFVGTESGLWVSLDGGKQWAQYTGGDFPNVAVRDLAIHPRDKDLVIATHGRGIWIIDDITPLRALTPELLAREAAFIDARPMVQRIPAGGGWANGDAVFVGENPTEEAVITYYQQKRHIFGDLKIEILDSTGKVLSTIPSSKRRGLNRATWPMRLKAPRVPTAASAAFGATIGPRVLPGTYTVRMSKDKNVYTTQLVVTGDPRSKYTPADRKAQFDLSMKLYSLLADMTFAVDRLNGVRLALEASAAGLPANDPLAARLRAASAEIDVLRKKIVATKEGGAITGEERLRENLADLYSNVLNYEGKPTEAQLARTDAITRELADVVRDFDAWLAKELTGLNAALSAKQLPPVKVITRAEWDKE
ncbi:MAG TPA: hypothetical protein VHQ95_01435, partial [Pyrinomonadaceae bacterium]|nr:hypothetical protein [Pyrinomonadaceae bacterium]